VTTDDFVVMAHAAAAVAPAAATALKMSTG
jgi:hypothetical protein